jgi:ribosomal protein L29
MAKKAETKVTTKSVKSTVTTKDLRAQNVAELNDTLKSVKADLAEAKRSHAAGELVNPRVLSMFKKTIARVQTLIVEKTREAQRKED